MTLRICAIALSLTLVGCRVGVLFEPLPHYVWACVRWDALTVTVNGQSVSTPVCREMGWTRAVDTVRALPTVP